MSLFSDTDEVSLKLCRLCPASQPAKKGSLLAPFLTAANASHEASRTCPAMVSSMSQKEPGWMFASNVSYPSGLTTIHHRNSFSVARTAIHATTASETVSSCERITQGDG